MKLEMYIDEGDLRKILGKYFSRIENQKVEASIKKKKDEIVFEYRRLEQINGAPVIVSVFLNLDEILSALTNVSEKYDALAIRACVEEGKIQGFYIDVKEKGIKRSYKK